MLIRCSATAPSKLQRRPLPASGTLSSASARHPRPPAASRHRVTLVARNVSGDTLQGTMYVPVANKTVNIGTIFTPSFVGAPFTSVYFYE